MCVKRGSWRGSQTQLLNAVVGGCVCACVRACVRACECVCVFVCVCRHRVDYVQAYTFVLVHENSSVCTRILIQINAVERVLTTDWGHMGKYGGSSVFEDLTAVAGAGMRWSTGQGRNEAESGGDMNSQGIVQAVSVLGRIFAIQDLADVVEGVGGLRLEEEGVIIRLEDMEPEILFRLWRAAVCLIIMICLIMIS